MARRSNTHPCTAHQGVWRRWLLTAACGLVAWACQAGEPATIRGQSDRFTVSFLDPLELRTSEIEIHEWDAQELGYIKKRPPVAFWRECQLSGDVLSCRAKGTSPMAGARYRLTMDATPSCPGQSEPRWTCVSGCTSRVPRYLSINPWEC